MKFTAKWIRGLKTTKPREEFWDDSFPGFGIMVSIRGNKTWYYLYWFEGKKQRLKIGKYPALSLSEAHTKAIEARNLVARGIEPNPKKKANHSVTVKDIALDYFEKYAQVACRPRTIDSYKSGIDKYIIPYLGDMPANEVRAKHIFELRDTMEATGVTRAMSRIQTLIGMIYTWAYQRDKVSHNPCYGLKSPYPTKSAARPYTKKQIQIIWEFADMKKEHNALKLMLSTGQRPNEVISINRNEIDFDNNAWILPGSKAKNKKDHWIPLSPLSLDIINQSLEESIFGIDYYKFYRETIREEWPIYREKRDLDFHLRCKDFRSTLGTHMSQELEIPDVTISRILNHSAREDNTVTRKHYIVHSHQKEKRQAMNLYGEYLQKLINL